MPIPLLTPNVFGNRFPIKHAWDALALGKQLVSPGYNLDQKLKCIDFYFNADGINNLYATQGRTGFHWSQLTLGVAADLAAGGDGEYTYIPNKIVFYHSKSGVRYTKLDWRHPTGTILNALKPPHMKDPFFFHTHHPYWRVRSARLKKMKIVVVVRSIFEVLESYYFKYSNIKAGQTTIDDESSFPWDEQISVAINFYNSWGDVINWHPKCLGLTYNDLKADQAGAHKAIFNHWGMDVPLECCEEAVKRTTKEEMAKRGPQEQLEFGHRVSLRKERRIISQNMFDHILWRLKKELVYDFGYTYDENHQYGFEYS